MTYLHWTGSLAASTLLGWLVWWLYMRRRDLRRFESDLANGRVVLDTPTVDYVRKRRRLVKIVRIVGIHRDPKNSHFDFTARSVDRHTLLGRTRRHFHLTLHLGERLYVAWPVRENSFRKPLYRIYLLMKRAYKRGGRKSFL